MLSELFLFLRAIFLSKLEILNVEPLYEFVTAKCYAAAAGTGPEVRVSPAARFHLPAARF
jgi:hypothetical protein